MTYFGYDEIVLMKEKFDRHVNKENVLTEKELAQFYNIPLNYQISYRLFNAFTLIHEDFITFSDMVLILDSIIGLKHPEIRFEFSKIFSIYR
eukprot:UN31960